MITYCHHPIPRLSSTKHSHNNQTYQLTQSIKPPNIQFHPLKHRQIHQSILALDHISQHDLPALSLLLKSAIRTRDLNLGKLLYSRLMESKLELDSLILNSFISLYSKCGEYEKAVEIFEMMGKKRNLVSWSSMVSCFVNNGLEFKAIETFVKMLGLGFYPNEFCFSGVIRACCNDQWAYIGEIIHGFVLKTGFFYDLCVGCGLIDLYVLGFNELGYARKVFDKMPHRNVVVWTLIISRSVQMGFAEKAIELFLEMELSGCGSDKYTFTCILSACAELKLVSFGKQLHSRITRSGLAADASVGCSLIEMYAKCDGHDSLECSRKVFDQIGTNNVLSWTALINAFTQKGGHDEEALELYCSMVKGGQLTPNHFTLASVLKACTNLANVLIGEQVFGHAVKLGLASDKFVGNCLISLYSQSGRTEEARWAFDVLLEKNLVSYNALLDGYARNGNIDEAFELFNEIENSDMRTNVFMYTSLLSAAASIGAGGKGEQIHARVIKSGYSDQHIRNALISMYSRCGDIEAAHRVFNEMGDRNVISWTSMITGFAKHGFGRQALGMFHHMTEAGARPNEVTFTAVLSACSHVGLVSEGKRYFDSMHKDYGVVPTMEHYACMVDLLGRSGCVVEARDFIDAMPFKANILVWRTLLGACLVHGNTEIGEHGAKMILEQDPDDPASYTLLSNFYASKGQWEEVNKIRGKMKEKNLYKEAGCSWIETENGLIKFFVGDTSNSRAREIHEKLDELICEIREMGYVPNTDFVLHDLEEEQKEQYLLQHSEKIAVVYGLLSMPRSKPIRVFKNLRICGDCHVAMKYISKNKGREIIVRDSNRFHHFRDGFCSCNDHW